MSKPQYGKTFYAEIDLMSQTQPASPAKATVKEESYVPPVDWDTIKVAKRTGETVKYFANAEQGLNTEIERAALRAQAIQQIQDALSQKAMLKTIMTYYNSPLGFMCDRPNSRNEKPYTEQEVIAAVTQALLIGVHYTGNEMNIIAGRCYVTQAGFWRLFNERPGVSNVEVIPGTPQIVNERTLVRVCVRWKQDGDVRELKDAKGDPGVVFPVIVNGGMGPDAIVGKAKRKALALAFQQASGKYIPDAEVDDVSAQAEQPKTTGQGTHQLRPEKPKEQTQSSEGLA